jgi:predicted HD superfamily hydrolase involved in NAD metabolism
MDYMDYIELSRKLESRMGKLLSVERADHSRRVAALAAELCSREGIDPERGRVAGLAHDLCKEMPKKAQRQLAAHYPEAGKSSALMADKVVHGPAAAVLLAREYKVVDQELLEAVALHTVGRPGMSALAAILYCSDKLEPGRERLSAEYRGRCLSLPLDSMLLAVVEGCVGWMRSQGRDVAPETLILYSSLQNKADQS